MDAGLFLQTLNEKVTHRLGRFDRIEHFHRDNNPKHSEEVTEELLNKKKSEDCDPVVVRESYRLSI